MEKIENGKVYFPRRELYGTLIFVVITLLNFHLKILIWIFLCFKFIIFTEYNRYFLYVIYRKALVSF